MAQTHDAPALSAGNHLYLYKLLVEQVGCGRQTFVTRIEEALAADRMTAEDLGFASTRELLEELDDFVELRVFKGGRIYATIVAQPSWDAALAEQQQEKEKTGGKPARRRGRGKVVRPVKPHRVHREPPAEPAAEGSAEPQAAAGANNAIDGAGPMPMVKDDMTAEVADASDAAQNEGEDTPEQAETAAEAPKKLEPAPIASTEPEPKTQSASEPAAPSASEPAVPAAPEPATTAISLTIVYDPDEEPADVPSQPSQTADAVAAAPSETGKEAPSTRSVSAAAEPGTPPSSRALQGYPKDFAAEVYLSPALEAQLAAALPLCTQAAPTLARAFDEAVRAGALLGNRAQASFEVPLPESALTCTATIRRRSAGTFAWALSALEFKAH